MANDDKQKKNDLKRSCGNLVRENARTAGVWYHDARLSFYFLAEILLLYSEPVLRVFYSGHLWIRTDPTFAGYRLRAKEANPSLDCCD